MPIYIAKDAYIHWIKTLIIFISVFTFSMPIFARPDSGGRIVFLGKTSNGQKSVWLSATGVGAFEVQARNQTIDQWTKSQSGLHLTLSPIVSNGSGDPHSLYQIINNSLVFLDKDNQQGGVIFPPLPTLPPPIVTPPIALPPNIPAHPIVIPPGSPSHPIVIPPGSPSHPIVIPPGSPSHPIVIPPGSPSHPIVIPPGSPSHPIVIPPGSPSHPIVIPPEKPTPPNQPIDPNQPINSTNTSQEEPNSNSALKYPAPITEGRDFDLGEQRWDFWLDGRYYNLSDNRYGLDRQGQMTNFTAGLDMQINNDVVAGMMLAKINGHSTSFDNNWRTNANGYNIGPYFGYRWSPHWTMDIQLAYGQIRNSNNICDSDGTYTSRAYSASLMTTGQYNVGSFLLRPKPSINYTYFQNTSYNLNGMIEGSAFTVPIDQDNFSFGVAEFALETSRPTLSTNGKHVITPYIELGIDYQYSRPNNGQILTSELMMKNTSPWSGLARAGVRMLITKSLFIDASGSYLSFNQPGLNIWETRAYLSYAFG